ncbi:MAG TPA: thiamine phosphate synthase [Gemmatimonadaceae bacterium]|nr:thiamine phosphate synthase [Gemmatimonadaceae bacterium]
MCSASDDRELEAGSGEREGRLPVSRSPLPVVHAVTDDLILTRHDFRDRARDVMSALGPRGAVHLRARIIPAASLLAMAEWIAGVREETGCWLVVNDRVDVALAADADGVQLTSRSLAVADARRLAPELAVGASIHEVEAGIEAERAGADWVVAGHVFETASHPGEEGRGLPFIAALRRRVHLPVVAIGGIVPARVAELRAAGVHGVAAISGIWGAHDAERAATDYLSAYDGARSPAR